MANRPRYPWNLNTLREIEEVLLGQPIRGFDWRPGELADLERRARQIGGARLKEVLMKIGAQREAAQ